MEKETPSAVELVKEILLHLRTPDDLNNHPWAVQPYLDTAQNHKNSKNPGEYLVEMVTATFRKMVPPNPPRKGKRMDTRWGVFGILAAQYFAPLILNEPFPSSLRDAWEKLDDSILFFVYGHTDGLEENDVARYRFARNEPEPSANSTLSDWHRKGIEQLAEMVDVEQKRLNTGKKRTQGWGKTVRQVSIAVGLLFFLTITFLGWKAWNLYQHIQGIEMKADVLEAYLTSTPKLEKIPEITSKVHDLRMDLDLLQTEARPYLWLTPYLGWIPKYGGTIRQAEPILDLMQNLTTAADEALIAVTPAIEMALSNDKPLEVMDLILQLQSASPQLLNAQVALAQAQDARKQLDVVQLLPRIKNIVTDRIDPLFTSISGAFPMQDALTMVQIAPKLLGGDNTGPQTYLILIQNEDELRPTGGFLTAAGSAVVKDGKLISINIASSELVDDVNKPYPIPPWQFEQYMNIEMFLFRDSNWFTDFPTTASWTEYFYSYSRASSADGIIAIDMHVIVRLLETLGPIYVENVSYPITNKNVLDYLRSAEETRPQGVTGVWDRKQFLSKLAKPLLEKVLSARGQTWTQLVPVLVELLDEKHILLQMDNEEASALLQRRNWDGAVRIPNDSDYLMVVDTNMGYNKSNAIMESSLNYLVELTDLGNPSGLLLVKQTNHSNIDIPCEPFFTGRFLLPPTQPGEIPDPVYNIDECHWGYLRVYAPEDTKLLRANPREIPAESTMLGETIPARTDDLGSEDIPGAQVFGMMVITPTHQSTVTEIEYALPKNVVTRNNNNSWTYRLKVQKQPGMFAQSFVLTLKLPKGTKIESATIPFTENDGAWTAQLDLRHDLTIEVVFSTP
jgi:hypothetical protein